MRIGVIGINHKLADLALREPLAKICQRRFSSNCSTHGDHAFVLLTTCNRTEIYFYSDDLAETHSYLVSILRRDMNREFDQRLYSYFGYDCFLHLSRVTAGLDSALIAETEIQGQVKDAYEQALSYSTLPFDLHYLFQKALKIGKKVRSELPVKPGLPGLGDAIHQRAQLLYDQPETKKFLCVGASDINAKIISFLKCKKYTDITLCNRSLGRGKDLACKEGVAILHWQALDTWHRYDCLVFGTKSPSYLLTKSLAAENWTGHKLIIDLCVPRNVDPALQDAEGLTLLNIDQLNHTLQIRRQHVTDMLVKAEQHIMESTKLHDHLFRNRRDPTGRCLPSGLEKFVG